MKYQYILKQVRKEEQLGSVVIQSLKDVNLEIEEGTFNSICGPEGSGKSRILNILGMINMPTAGEFQYKNRIVSQLTEREISAIRATKISYIPQFLNMNLTSSVLENVSMMAKILGADNKEAQEKAMYWLRKVGLSTKAHCIPLELDLVNIKKILIAKAMVKKPEILLLDDIYNKLNSSAAEELQNLLIKINHDHHVTIIQTTRNVDHTKASAFVYDINDGKTSKRCLASTAA
jgi:putative ABC transport system ATP-binding protein